MEESWPIRATDGRGGPPGGRPGLPSAPPGPSLRAVPVVIGERLTIQDVVAVACGAEVVVSPAAAERMRAARAVVDEKVAAAETVYGVTTGLGSLANVRLAPD